jgi:hypothetical protein
MQQLLLQGNIPLTMLFTWLMTFAFCTRIVGTSLDVKFVLGPCALRPVQVANFVCYGAGTSGTIWLELELLSLVFS